jgi:hypothetical protein
MVSDHFSPFAVFARLPGHAPTVTVPDNMIVAATSTAGAAVSFAATATDSIDGPITPVCVPASGSTFKIGTSVVTCTATNSLGLSGSATFSVSVQYKAPSDGTFFLQPINPDSTSIFKRGSTVPVKFKLQGASASITDLVAHLYTAKITNSVSGCYVEAASSSAADAGNTFRYDSVARQYIFNLSTKALTVGTWSLRADLGDGVEHTVNVSLR